MRKGQSTKFRTPFKTFVCEGDRITAELPGGYTATATIVRDDCVDRPDQRDDGFWPSRDPKAAGYIGAKSDRTFRKHMARAKATLLAWEADEWFYCGVCVTIEKDGVQLTGNYDHALWGVDCNYPAPSRWRRNGYLLTVANELLPEAIESAQNKVEQLAA